jgi:hypothetical protein
MRLSDTGGLPAEAARGESATEGEPVAEEESLAKESCLVLTSVSRVRSMSCTPIRRFLNVVQFYATILNDVQEGF